jgi:hypothetical protein
MPNLNSYFKMTLIFDSSIVEYSWSGMGITGCKPDYPSSMKITAMTYPSISPWRAYSWWSIVTLHLWLHLCTMLTGE